MQHNIYEIGARNVAEVVIFLLGQAGKISRFENDGGKLR